MLSDECEGKYGSFFLLKGIQGPALSQVVDYGYLGPFDRAFQTVFKQHYMYFYTFFHPHTILTLSSHAHSSY